jgi:hypothetical protein
MLDYLYIGPVPGGPPWWPPITYPWGKPSPGPIAVFSEQRGPVPNPWHAAQDPWSTPAAVAFLVSAVSSKVAAANMTNKTAAQQIIVGADQAITAFIDSDDICPRWPLPGPPLGYRSSRPN